MRRALPTQARRANTPTQPDADAMQLVHVPRLDRAYWVALCLASIAGANAGDLEAHGLGLGHVNGLPILAACFAATLLLEQRSDRRGTGFYWTAILLVRMAATNAADLLTHDLRLPYPATIAGLGLATLVLALPTRRRQDGGGRMATDGWYWAAMLAAGTLGTAIGDAVAEAAGLGTGPATLLLGVLPCLVLAAAGIAPGRLGYWLAVVAIRSAGTTAGDFTAGRLGLAWSTAAFVLLVAAASAWPVMLRARASSDRTGPVERMMLD